MPKRFSLTVEGMHCAACAETVSRALKSVKGVKDATVNFATERALVEIDDNTDFHHLVTAVEKAGYKLATQTLKISVDKPLSDGDERTLKTIAGVIAVETTTNVQFPTPIISIRYLDGVVSRHQLLENLKSLGFQAKPIDEKPEKLPQDEAKAAWTRGWGGLGFSFVIMLLTMHPILVHQAWARWLSFLLATLVMAWVGAPFFRRAFAAALQRTANMDTLVSIGALSAYGYSVWVLLTWNLTVGHEHHLYFDSAAFILSAISLGKGLEAKARAIATSSLRKLVSLLPSKATVIRNGLEQNLPSDAIQVGDIVLVRTGERVPVDGIVVAGKGSVDESLLTGESEPIDKSEGDEVLGGSLCVDGFLQVEALRVGESTFIAQMARLIDEAQATKPKMQRLADKVASVFVPIVLLLAAATFIGWIVLTGDLTKAFVAAVSVTVIACPCAMGLATPTAIAVALGRLAQIGILVRNAEAMEKASNITAVVLDKTGTVTRGQMKVVAVWVGNGENKVQDENELLMLAASAEQGSLHPIAQAILYAAKERNLTLLQPSEIRTEVGIGVFARFDEQDNVPEKFAGAKIFVGKIEVNELTNDSPLREWLENGWSVVGVWFNEKLVGGIALADELRSDAVNAVHELKAAGVKVYLATGDKPQVAIRVSEQLDCDGVWALATPQRKAQLIRELQKDGERVLMVGDGINDAVALSQADIGIAIASGADLTAQAADALMVTERLTVLPEFLSLAKRTRQIMVQNLFWAFAYNMAALPLAAAGKLNPMVAAVAMALSSITVVGNALRLRWKAKIS
ncbi:MAG: heavy metal translocating P-type ATPase [Armatimonadota bacterium]